MKILSAILLPDEFRVENHNVSDEILFIPALIHNQQSFSEISKNPLEGN